MTRYGLENGVEHLGVEAIRLRIISTAMVTIEERARAGQRMNGPVRERVLAWAIPKRKQYGAMGNRSQRENRAARAQFFEFEPEIAVAVAYLSGLGFVLWREALDGIRYAATGQDKAVVTADRLLGRCESEAMQRAVQKNAGIVAGERPAGAVRPVHARGESHNQQACTCVPEGRHRSRVVLRMIGLHRIEEGGKPRAIPTLGIKTLEAQGRRTHL